MKYNLFSPYCWNIPHLNNNHLLTHCLKLFKQQPIDEKMRNTIIDLICASWIIFVYMILPDI
jgi:hypothetical protein